MESSVCSVCFKPKAKLKCGICEGSICKSCTIFLEDDNFAYLNPLPDTFIDRTFCSPCFDTKVQPALDDYNQDMEKARNVFVFYKAENKESRFFKRVEKPLKVTDLTDRDETVLKLAYLAVKVNCNVIVDVDLVSEKVKTGSYQTSKWSGTAHPVEVDPRNMERKTKY